jgi:CubicO group peptidase (beta-lactamase class C family)
VIVSCAVLALASGCGEGPDRRIARVYDDLAAAPVETGEVAGLSAVVLRGTDVQYRGAHGLRDVAAGKAMDTDAPLALSDAGKTLVAFLALQLAREGVMDLDAPVVDQLPEAADWLDGRITLRHLLRHTSGLPELPAADAAKSAIPAGPDDERVLAWARRQPLLYEPGTNWSHSDTGYHLAGLVLRRASGQDWATLVGERLAQAAGASTLRTCEALAADARPTGYRRIEGGFTPVTRGLYGASSGVPALCASPMDLARVLRAAERDGLLDPEDYGEVTLPTRLADGTWVDYGFGVRLGSVHYHCLWGNAGGGETHVAAFLRCANDDLTVVVLHNTVDGSGDALAVARAMAEAALGLMPPRSGANVSFGDASYLGEYRYDDGLSAPERSRIERVAGAIARRDLSGGDPELLIPEGNDWFRYRGRPRDRLFFPMPRGEVTGYSEYRAGVFHRYHRRVDR